VGDLAVRKEYVFLMGVLVAFSMLLVALFPQPVIGNTVENQYAVGGEIVSETPASGSFLTSQLVLAAVAAAAAAATAGILIYGRQRRF